LTLRTGKMGNECGAGKSEIKGGRSSRNENISKKKEKQGLGHLKAGLREKENDESNRHMEDQKIEGYWGRRVTRAGR